MNRGSDNYLCASSGHLNHQLWRTVPNESLAPALLGPSEFESVSRVFLAEQLPLEAIAAVKAIEVGDEAFLTARELATMGSPLMAVQRASGAARCLARQLFDRLGIDARDLPRSGTGAPLWPVRVIGSLAHDAAFAAAVVARSGKLKGVGIDIEPSERLEAEVAELVATDAGEREQFGCDSFGDKALFCIKEAVFKAVNPHDEIFLEFDEVVVDRSSQTARTCYGRQVRWRVLTSPRVIAIAWWP
jgi:4'-phosphopantetheinyl transferase EntD